MNVKGKYKRLRELVISDDYPKDNHVLWLKPTGDNTFIFYIFDGIDWISVMQQGGDGGGVALEDWQLEAIRKASRLKVDGSGNLFLSDNGNYKSLDSYLSDVRNNIASLNNRITSAEGRIGSIGSGLDSKADKSSVPTKVGQLVNDKGYITKNDIPAVSGYATKEYVDSSVNAVGNTIPTNVSQLNNDKNYVDNKSFKTINGQSVIGSGNIEINPGADVIVDSDISGTSTNPIQNKAVAAALNAVSSNIPTKVSQLSNDKGYLTEHQSLDNYYTKQRVDSDIKSVRDSIPTRTSQIENDSNFLTEHQKLKTINNESIVGEGNITIISSSGDGEEVYDVKYCDVYDVSWFTSASSANISKEKWTEFINAIIDHKLCYDQNGFWQVYVGSIPNITEDSTIELFLYRGNEIIKWTLSKNLSPTNETYDYATASRDVSVIMSVDDVLYNEMANKVGIIKTDGDGTKYLNNKGEYVTITQSPSIKSAITPIPSSVDLTGILTSSNLFTKLKQAVTDNAISVNNIYSFNATISDVTGSDSTFNGLLYVIPGGEEQYVFKVELGSTGSDEALKPFFWYTYALGGNFNAWRKVILSDDAATKSYVLAGLDTKLDKTSAQSKFEIIEGDISDLKTKDTTFENTIIANQEAIQGLGTNKQDKLVSGTNIKTINGNSLLGNGDITLSSGSSGASSYAELTGKPSINGVTISSGDNSLDALGIQPKGEYMPLVDLADVAKSGLYSDLKSAPKLFSKGGTSAALVPNPGVAVNDNAVLLASGAWGDAKPYINRQQLNKDYYMMFSDSIGGYGMVIAELALTYNPYDKNLKVGKINGIDATKLAVTDNIPIVPTKTSQLENDSNFLTEHQSLDGYAKKTDIPTIPTNVSAFINDEGYLTEHQSLDNYYTKEQTNSSINTALDAVNEVVAVVPQTYDIGWLLNLISTSGVGIVTLTAEQFNEVKAAYDAGKIFVANSNVYSSAIRIDGGNTAIGLMTLSGSNIVTILSVTSRNGIYNANLSDYEFITQYDLYDYAKASDVPTKTSQLTNDSGYLTEHQSIKTINGESIVGTGNLTIQSGSAGGLEYESVNNTESEYSVAPVIGKLIDLTGLPITKMTIETPGNIADVANGPLKSNIAIVRFKSSTDLTFVHSSAYKFIKGDTSIEIADNVYYEIVITPISVSSASNYKFGLSYAYYV